MNHVDEKVTKTISSLSRNRIKARYFPSQETLLTCIKERLTSEMTVGVGDSKTLEDLGVYSLLRQSEVNFLDKYADNISREKKRDLYIKNFAADLFFSGINALSTDGKIYNLDGNGSRVAPIIYGPSKVFLICGTNKIVTSEDEAFNRVRNIAAPIDAKRLGKRTPCVRSGKCMDCKAEDRICNYFTIIQGQFDSERITVFIVDGDYGF